MKVINGHKKIKDALDELEDKYLQILVFVATKYKLDNDEVKSVAASLVTTQTNRLIHLMKNENDENNLAKFKYTMLSVINEDMQ